MHFLLFYLKVSALQLKTALQNGKLASEKCLDDGQPANKFSWRRSEVGAGGGGSVVWKFRTPVTRQRKDCIQRSSRALWKKISCFRFRYLVKSNCQFRAHSFYYLITFGLFYIWGKPAHLSYGKHVQQKRATANDPNQVVASCENSDFWLDKITW